MTFKGRCKVGWGRNECYCSLDKERKRGQQVQHTKAQRWKGLEYSGNGEDTGWSGGSQKRGSRRYSESRQEAFPYNLPGTILRVSSFTDIRSYWSVLRVLRRE